MGRDTERNKQKRQNKPNPFSPVDNPKEFANFYDNPFDWFKAKQQFFGKEERVVTYVLIYHSKTPNCSKSGAMKNFKYEQAADTVNTILYSRPLFCDECGEELSHGNPIQAKEWIQKGAKKENKISPNIF